MSPRWDTGSKSIDIKKLNFRTRQLINRVLNSSAPATHIPPFCKYTVSRTHRNECVNLNRLCSDRPRDNQHASGGRHYACKTYCLCCVNTLTAPIQYTATIQQIPTSLQSFSSYASFSRNAFLYYVPPPFTHILFPSLLRTLQVRAVRVRLKKQLSIGEYNAT